VSAAAHILAPHFLNRTVLQRRADMSGETGRVRIVRIDDVGHFRSQCEYLGIADFLFGESREARGVIEKAHRDAIGRAELGRIGRRRHLLTLKRLPQTMHRALAHFANKGFDVVRLDAAPRKFDGAVDIGLGHGPAGILLERDRRHVPGLAETREQRHEVRRAARREGKKEPVLALEHGHRAHKAVLCQ
jgi:hypothetical protein